MRAYIFNSRLCLTALVAVALQGVCTAQDSRPGANKSIPRGAKVYIAPFETGFETYLAAGLVRKQVPVTIVSSRDKAEFEVAGIAESEKAGWAKMLFMGSDSSKEQAGIKVVRIETGDVVFAYAVHKAYSVRGKQSAAESCAKHLKRKIEEGK
jgi:hypothetical protein